MIRLAAIGTSSTGKSSALNALFDTKFETSPRARTTVTPSQVSLVWKGRELEITDTPPLDASARHSSADAYLLVCDKDLIDLEYKEVIRISRLRRPVAVAVNKTDLYSPAQRRQLLQHVRRRLDGVVRKDWVVTCSADPVRISNRETADGEVRESHTRMPADVRALAPVIEALLSAAENSIRVKARELQSKTRDVTVEASSRVAAWIRSIQR